LRYESVLFLLTIAIAMPKAPGTDRPDNTPVLWDFLTNAKAGGKRRLFPSLNSNEPDVDIRCDSKEKRHPDAVQFLNSYNKVLVIEFGLKRCADFLGGRVAGVTN
jgi:hypothetical protein